MAGFFDSDPPDIQVNDPDFSWRIDPEGLLAGLDPGFDFGASAQAWADGTHILSPQNGEAIDISVPLVSSAQYTPDFQSVHLPDIIPNPISASSPADMTASDSGTDFIKSWEQGPGGGAALKQYPSPEKGADTVGWGHKIQPGEKFSKGVTAAQANQQFSDDLSSHQKLVQDNVTVPLSQQQFDALTSLAYNLPAA